MKPNWYSVKVRWREWKQDDVFHEKIVNIEAYTAEDAVFQILYTDRELHLGLTRPLTREEKHALCVEVHPAGGDTSDFYRR